MKSLVPLPLLVSALVLTAGAADQTTPTAPASSSGDTVRETPRSYSDHSSTIQYRVDSNFSNYPYYGSPHGSHFGPGFGGYSGTIQIERRRIFLPPVPPALGEALRSDKPGHTLSALALPPTLRSYVYETFYAPLSALMYSEDLSRKRRETLDAYLAARTQAVTALRAQLDSLAGADPDTRARELAAFAPTQAAAIAALETTAESIRDNLVNGSLFQSGVDWNNLRDWRLGDDTRWESQADEIKVVIGSAFFQEGLSAPQRLLLRELAMELSDSLRSPDAEIALNAPGPYLYFSPSAARIRLPANLPPELEAKIDDYRAKKTVLKNELRDALYRGDRAFWESTRINSLKALAVKQAPDFAAVEQLAEEIRVGLSAFPNPARPAALPVPPALMKRIAAYIGEKAAWQKTMLEKQTALRAQFPDDRVEFTRAEGRPTLQIVANRRSKPELKTKREAAQAELAVFNATQRKSYDALVKEKELVNAEILQIAGTLASRASVKSIDQLLLEFGHSLGQQENWLRYADYETAVLQPGLSPEQRRLLFGAALEKLDLPLTER